MMFTDEPTPRLGNSGSVLDQRNGIKGTKRSAMAEFKYFFSVCGFLTAVILRSYRHAWNVLLGHTE